MKQCSTNLVYAVFEILNGMSTTYFLLHQCKEHPKVLKSSWKWKLELNLKVVNCYEEIQNRRIPGIMETVSITVVHCIDAC